MTEASRVRRTKKPAPVRVTAADDNGREADVPAGHSWTVKVWVHPSARSEEAKGARKRVSRASHAAFEPAPWRDPIAILEAQEADRLQDLVPLRHARMAESPFAYYRGTPAVMAFDLANAARTGITVQASGDAHLSNFGLFASPERTLVFDLERLRRDAPGAVGMGCQAACCKRGHRGPRQRIQRRGEPRAAMGAVGGYREWMGRYAAMRLVEVLYATITAEDIVEAVEASGRLSGRARCARRKALEALFAKARRRGRHARLRLTDRDRRRATGDPRRPARADPRRLSMSLAASRARSPTTGRRCRRVGATSSSATDSSTSP